MPVAAGFGGLLRGMQGPVATKSAEQLWLLLLLLLLCMKACNAAKSL